jgi:Pyridoxamine 5'-phosphate oxidase
LGIANVAVSLGLSGLALSGLPDNGAANGTAWNRTRAGMASRLEVHIGAIMGQVTAWQDVEQAEPEFARRVRALFDAHRHKTLATLRADGSPRISGIETVFEDGELVFGSMPNARKGADLHRDPRFALHSATVDPVEGSEGQWPGEAKIYGRAIAAGPITQGPDGDRFHADIAEVVHTHLNEEATMLVVEWWTPTHGLRRIERE